MYKIISLFMLIVSLSYSIENIEGKEYYSTNEIMEKGIEVNGDNLEYKGRLFKTTENQVVIEDFIKPYEGVKQTREKSEYVAKLLIDEILLIGEKNERVEKVVSLSPGITEKIYALGLGDTLIGRTIYCEYPEEVKKVEEVGTMFEPNFEKILLKGTDIVLMETHFKPGFLTQLESAGIDYITYKTPKTVDEIYIDLIDLGVSLGVEERARIIVASLKEIVKEYEEKIGQIEDKKTVYYAVGAGKGDYTAGRDTFINDLIVKSGGINIAGEKKGWGYSLEELLVRNPNVIIAGERVGEIIKNEKKYSMLTAVKEGKVEEVDIKIMELPGVRAIEEGLPIIYELLYRK